MLCDYFDFFSVMASQALCGFLVTYSFDNLSSTCLLRLAFRKSMEGLFNVLDIEKSILTLNKAIKMGSTDFFSTFKVAHYKVDWKVSSNVVVIILKIKEWDRGRIKIFKSSFPLVCCS